MSANALLLWMSARVEGSWQQFRSAVEELHLSFDEGTDEVETEDSGDQYAMPIYQMLRLNLQRLGHAEFFSGAGSTDWRVAPPALAITRHPSGWRGILAGARSPHLLEVLDSIASLCTMEMNAAKGCPDPVRLQASTPDRLIAAARHLGLRWQMDAAAAILQCLPIIDDITIRHPNALPLGPDWRVDVFSASDLSWVASSRAEAESSSKLSRWTLGHQRLFFLRRKGGTYSIPGQVGKYLVLRQARKRILHYDRNAAMLRMPAVCRPPFLVERAIIARSGYLPEYSAATGHLSYHDVDDETAHLVSGILKQELS